MAIVYLFAVFDAYRIEEMTKRITPDEMQRLRAFRHIRNGAAHGTLFERAPDCKWRQHFEDAMNSGNRIAGVIFDDTLLNLTGSSAELGCYDFLSNLVQQLVARLNSP